MDQSSVNSKRTKSEPDAMQSAGIKLINKIIEAEQNARKLAEEAYEKRDSMRSALGVTKEELRREYFGRAEIRIQKVREQNEILGNEKMKALDDTYRRDLERIEKAFEENQDKWADKLFGIIIGRD